MRKQNGYTTKLGIFHNNTFNPFNLGCDLVEPFRPVVDSCVYFKGFGVFEKEQKHEMLEVFERQFVIGGQKQYLPNVIRIYCRSVFDALNEKDPAKIKFFEAEQ